MQVSRLRARGYEELCRRYLDTVEGFDQLGPSGVTYQFEVQGLWDAGKRHPGDLRILVSIDDGRGWRAFAPLVDDFIISPDGSFVGEPDS